MRLKYLLIVSYFSLFTFHFSFAQKWIWADNGKGIGTVNAVTSDANGGCYAIGTFETHKMIFGTDTLLNNDYYNNTFLVKYNSHGKQRWATSPTTKDTNDIEGFSVATDTHGNIYITGEFADTTYFGSIKLVATPADYYEAFIAKYDSNGNVLWAKCSRQKLGAVVQSFGVATDKSGNAYITGVTNDSIWFGSNGLHPGVFLVKFDSGGNVIWTNVSGGAGLSSSYMSIQTDEFNNIYVTSDYDNPISFGAFNLPLTATFNSFLVKYDSAGKVKWATNSGGSSTATGVSVAIYGSACVYIAGWYDQGTLNFETDTLQTVGNQTNIFLVKYDTAGRVIWAKNSDNAGPAESIAYGVTSDKWGDAFLYGISDTNISFGADTLHSTTVWKNADFIVEFDSSGKVVCDTVLANIGNFVHLSNAVNMAVDPITQELYVGGILDNTPYIFGDDTTFCLSGQYPYIAKWLPCGDTLWDAGIKPSTNISHRVLIYPNPNNGTFTIALQNVNELARVVVYNVLGEEVYQIKLNFSDTQINLGSQPEGVYFYRVITENGGLIGSGKLIVE
jgi:hypothetical protein